MIRAWWRFRDFTGVEGSDLISHDEPLSYSPVYTERYRISAGINTASSSLPISLILNVGAANAEAINVDCYVSYDSLYFIDETGAIRVSM